MSLGPFFSPKEGFTAAKLKKSSSAPEYRFSLSSQKGFLYPNFGFLYPNHGILYIKISVSSQQTSVHSIYIYIFLNFKVITAYASCLMGTEVLSIKSLGFIFSAQKVFIYSNFGLITAGGILYPYPDFFLVSFC
jgi:hypothetical protein